MMSPTPNRSREIVGFERLLTYWEGSEHFATLADFAPIVLRELLSAGLSNPLRRGKHQPKQASTSAQREAPSGGWRVHAVELDRGRRVLVQTDAYTEFPDPDAGEMGYRAARVLDRFLSTDAAIIAAVSVLEFWREEAAMMAGDGDASTRVRRMGAKLPPPLNVNKYAVSLLRHHVPDFDDLPQDHQIALIGEVQDRVEAVARATDALMRTLEQGLEKQMPKDREQLGKLNAKVRAAQLRDIGGVSYPNIARLVGAPEPGMQDKIKNDHLLVRKEWVKGGRDVLERALGGEEAYRAYCEAKKDEAERFRALTDDERMRRLIANSLTVFGGRGVGEKVAELFMRSKPLTLGRIVRRILDHR